MNSDFSWLLCVNTSNTIKPLPGKYPFFFLPFLFTFALYLLTRNQCCSLRIDTGDDNRVSKEEFCADNIKAAVEKWVGTIEDMEAEFGKIDANGGGQV